MSNIDLTQIITAEDKAAVEQAARRALVDAERDRRLVAGATVTVAGYGDIPVQGRERDMVVYASLELTAMQMDAAGVTTAALPFRDRDNGQHLLTPAQMLDLMAQAKTAAQAIYAAAWNLKDGAPIPADVTDDTLWP